MKTRRQLRQKLGTRTTRRHGTKSSDRRTKPSILLNQLIEKELTK